MRTSVVVPVVGVAVVYTIAQGWLETAWKAIYTATHGTMGQKPPSVVPGTQGLYPNPPGSWNAQHPDQPIPGPLGGAQVR